jgi:putative glutathione S-transferase
VVEPLQGDTGWTFGTGPGATPDTVNGKVTLAEFYFVADPHFAGRVTMPALWRTAASSPARGRARRHPPVRHAHPFRR